METTAPNGGLTVPRRCAIRSLGSSGLEGGRFDDQSYEPLGLWLIQDRAAHINAAGMLNIAPDVEHTDYSMQAVALLGCKMSTKHCPKLKLCRSGHLNLCLQKATRYAELLVLV